jgi:uncharacterized OsmC-like protein
MQTIEKKGVMNGVDVDRLVGTMDAIRENPELAQFEFRATNRWMNGGHNRSLIQGFYGAGKEDTTRKASFVIDNDEPEVLLGADRGANPVEYALHALAGCLTTSLVYFAAAQGIRLDSVESTLEGQLDLQGMLGLSDEVRNGYRNIRVGFRVRGDASDAQLEELVELARRRSPMFDIISNPVPVRVTFESA